MPTLDESPTEELLEGRYRLGECVGRGGMAVVHRAEDLMLDRTVAIKIMRSGTDGPEAGARTRREMAALAALSHPNLVTLLDARIVPGGPEYLVMEFVDGPSLRDRLDDGPLTPAEVACVASDLADALDAAHGAGIVHRDIKPSNVLLAPTGSPARPFRAKLADFGIAQLLDGTRLTMPGVVLGTPAYVAPEQARGADPAPAADIFALGVVLLECFTGKRPFSNATPAEAIASRQVLPPDLPPDLDAGWATLLRRMTDLDPALRPTAGEVSAAVRDLGPQDRTQPLPSAVAAGEMTEAVEERRDPTLVIPVAAAAAAGASAGARGSSRRLRTFAALGAGSTAALIAAVVWASSLGTGTPAPADTVAPVVAPSAPEEQEAVVETEQEAPVTDDAPAEGPSKQDEKKAEKAEKAAEEARKAEEKAAEEARKAAEQQQKKAEKGNGKKND